ncbi:hypothetical protein EJD97_016767, partial [Solanum chilense]
MTMIWSATRRVEEYSANAVAPPQVNKVPPQGNQALRGDQVSVIPPAIADEEIRLDIVSLHQDMTVQVHFVATQGQAMTAQANLEVGPRVKQNSSTMVSRLREFTRMNPPMFFGYMVNKDPQDFLDVVYNILYA